MGDGRQKTGCAVAAGEARLSRRAQRRLELIVAGVAAAAVAVFVAIAAATAVPPMVQNLSTAVADGVTAYPVGDDGALSVVVPAEWIVQRPTEDLLQVVTPDGLLTTEIAAASGEPDDVLAALLSAEGVAPSGAVRAETITDGVRLVHVDSDSGDAVFAAVATPGGAAAQIIARTTADPRAYRPALAQLLAGVRS